MACLDAPAIHGDRHDMDERIPAQRYGRSRLSRSSYKHSATFPTRTKTRVFLHWKPSPTLTFTRCAGPKFILMNCQGQRRSAKKRMKSIVSQPGLCQRAQAAAQRAGLHGDA